MEMVFRFIMYAMFGITMEVIFSVIGIKYTLGYEIKRRVPKKYLEGFVSLYMIPIHGFGVLFLFEPIFNYIKDFNYWGRFFIWGILFVASEFLIGLIFDKIFKFYPWDWYKPSKYKIFKRAYSLWTYIPAWGLYGLLLEFYVTIILKLSQYLDKII